MAEEKAAASENGADTPSFNLQRVYLKDLSVEIPHAPGIFLDNTPPKLEFQVDSKDQELDNNMVEVSVKCSVNCRVGEKVGFLIVARFASAGARTELQARLFTTSGTLPI